MNARILRPALFTFLATLPAWGSGVVINEIMFHPVSENSLEEYIELHNTAATNINLNGWRFSRGVDFTLPSVVIPPQGYLVVAADVATFQAMHPGVANVVGGWVGQLSNIDEDVELQDAASNRVNSVRYADDGDWAIRQRGPRDLNTRGWEWYNEADGSSFNTATLQTVGGKSIELVNPLLPNDHGHAWLASVPVNGTPGQPNSVLTNNIAPLISDVSHFPPIPKPTDTVTVTAALVDEVAQGVTARVLFRNASTINPPSFSSTNMFDDGLHNDGLPADGIFGAFLPPRTNGIVVEFYVEARDAQGNIRTWPAAARLETGVFAQAANALYQVDENLAPPGPASADQPVYRTIMTEIERVEFASINRSSDAQMNATFISSDADGIKVRHNAGLRVRGAGSRSRTPHNDRLNLPSDRRWNGLNALNLNSQFIHLQVAGSALAAKSGVAAAQGRAIQMRINGANPSPSQPPVNGTGQGAGFGSFVYVEVFNADWPDRLMPTNSGGNIYRASRFPWTANLKFLNTTDPAAWISEGYSKTSNQSENDWSDINELTRALSSDLPEEEYLEAVRTNVNVEAFMRYFTLCNLMDYRETSLCGGVGDDYAMYRGTVDRRFMLIPHDFDTILGQGDSPGSTTRSIWAMIDSPRSTDPSQQALFLIRFLRHPEYAPIYFREFKRMLEGSFSPSEFNPMLDNLLGGWVPESMITDLKTFMNARRASVWSQLPLTNSVNVPLPIDNGYFTTTFPIVTLNGQANAIETKSIRVNGSPADFTVWRGRWTNTVAVAPGLNNVLIQYLDAAGAEIYRAERTIWYDDGSLETVAGTIATDTIWSPISGPYQVSGNLTVASGATLTIQPGTTVYLDPGVNLIVANGGRLVAQGTDTARIRFTRIPGSAATWGGITVNGGAGSPETRIAYAHFEFNGSTAIHSTGGTVFLDHLSFGNTARQYLSLDGSSFVVQDCVFPATTASFEPVHGTGGIKSGGRGLFLRNFFGPITGYNDVIDFTGGNRPGPIVQIINNVFAGSGDDLLDLDSTDAWVEGNIFMHVHKNGSPDSASAVSGGADNADLSQVTIIGNLFYDCDQAAMAKQGNFYTLLNNTIVRQTRQGGNDTEAAVVCMADEGTVEAAGMYLEGNIIFDAEQLVRNQTAAVVTFTNNLMPLPWSGPGGGNSTNDPLFKYIPQLAETTGFTTWQQAQVMRDWFSLRTGSPASATGPNGQDKGGIVPFGVSVSGEPEGATPLITATLRVGVNRTGNGIPAAGWPIGSGYTHYKWRLDGGAWSAETPLASPIQVGGLANGPHYVEVVGRRDSGTYQDDPALGRDATITRSQTWTVVPTASLLRLNEILASNNGAYDHFGTTPDAIEIYNAGTTAADIAGMALTDDRRDPGKFVFPAGATIPAGGYLVLLANNPDGKPGYHAGFNLSQAGQEVLLFNAAAHGGGLVDSVTFGPQLTDLSIGRVGDVWTLCQPTLGSLNQAAPLGDPHALRLNEWLTDGGTSSMEDFLELYNPQSWPVAMGGLYLTDNPIGLPARHEIAALSFLAGNGFFAFVADGNINAGPEHLDFRLGSEQGLIGLFDERLDLIDCVYYGPQRPGVAMGRQPDGGTNFASLVPPTPGAGNSVVLGGCTVTTTSLPLMSYSQSWRYNQTLDLTGQNWFATNFNDSAWPTGAGLLAFENAADIVPLINTFLEAPATPAPGLSAPRVFYFRTTLLVSNNLTGSEVIARLRIDDGAIIYLNGTELARIRMPSGSINYSTLTTISPPDALADEFLTIPANRLVQGTNVIAAQVHQSSASSSDIVWGMAMDVVNRQTNCITSPVVLNEILANNSSLTNSDGTVTDWIELFNPSTTATNLSGMSLTDDPADKRRWVIPPGIVLPAGGYLLVRCDPNSPPSSNNIPPLNTGFGLAANGDELYLYEASSQMTLLDGLTFGLQAADFAIGRIANGSGSWTLNLPTPGSVNIGASTGDPAQLKVNEWMANPSPGNDDWFEIHNPNSQPVALGNLYLSDDLGARTKYQIRPLSYIGSGGKGFAVFYADNNPQNGVDHVNFRLSGSGESLGIFSATQSQIDAITFGAQAENVSEGRLPDGGTLIVGFPLSPSRGNANYLPLTAVVINEALTHTDLPLEDAIELRNASQETLDVSGWWLSDARDDPKRFRIPEGTVLPPGGHAVFYEYQFNPPSDTLPSFALSSAGDEIHLSQSDAVGNLTGYRSVVAFDAAENGVSFGRYRTSVGEDFVAMSALSLGTSITRNDPTNLNTVFRTGQGATNPYPLVGPVVINEIMYNPRPDGTNDNTLDEFLELLNVTAAPVPLFDPLAPTNTWHLRDGVDFNFPLNVTLPAGGFAIVVNFNPTNTAQLAAFRSKFNVGAGVPVFGPYSGKLDNGGEGLNLRKPDAAGPDGNAPYVLVERVVYGDSSPWPSLADGNTNQSVGVSLQRRAAVDYGNDPVNWLAGLPTAGAGNGAALATLPAITTQPLSQSVPPGAGAVLSVVATGSGTLLYQWRLNGADIPGATGPFLTLNGTTFAAAGVYNVRISNPAGSVLSAPAELIVQEPPQITRQPQDRIVAANSPASLDVVARGALPLSYQWRKDGTPLPGATAFLLALTNVTLANEGAYSVVITNLYGATTSTVATLQVFAPPIILAQPQPTNVFVGGTVSLLVSADGTDPLFYQWRFGNTPLPGQTNALLSLNNVQLSQAGTYRVLVSNIVGTVLSDPAQLAVLVPPTIRVTATDRTATEEGLTTGQFTLTRGGDINPAVSVNIVISGTATPGSDYVAIAGPVFFAAGVTSAPVLVTPLDDLILEGNETIVLTLTSGAGYVLAAPSSATVTLFDDDNKAPLVTLTNPIANALFTAPAAIALGATATDPDGFLVKVEFFDFETNKIATITTAPYVFTWTNAPTGAHRLTAVATDNYGSTGTSLPVDILVNAPPSVAILSPINGVTLPAGSNITIAVTATDVDGSVTQVEFWQGATQLGIDTAAPYGFLWTNVAADSYTLTARATDNRGAIAVSLPVSITVRVPSAGFEDMFTNRGGIFGFTNQVTGNNSGYTREAGEPRHDLQSTNNGTRSGWLTWNAPATGVVTMETTGSTFDTVLAVYTNNPPSLQTLASLAKVTSNDDADSETLQSRVQFNAVAGVTYQIAVDGYNNLAYGSIVFRMNQSNPLPVILTPPASQIADPGTDVTFNITASGPAPLRYRWLFNGVEMPGANTNSLQIIGVQAANDGFYSAVVGNNAGSVTSAPALLIVRVAPTFITAPQTVVVDVGSNATFSVVAGGSPPIRYQWQFNGAALAGQTNASLVITHAQYTNGGAFGVTAANTFGSTTSDAAKLIVRPRLLGVQPVAGAALVTHLGTPGQGYGLQGSLNLTDWTTLLELTNAAVQQISTDTNQPAGGSRMYRLLVLP